MKAVLIISHGSRSFKTKVEVNHLIGKLKELTKISFIECAFLEIETPLIPEGIKQCVMKGATEIIILLNFLNSGRHVDIDIPTIIEKARKDFPQVKFVITNPIGQHPGLPQLFVDLLEPFSRSSP